MLCFNLIQFILLTKQCQLSYGSCKGALSFSHTASEFWLNFSEISGVVCVRMIMQGGHLCSPFCKSMPLLYVISETLLNVMQSSSNHTYVCMLVTDKRIFNYSYVCSMSIYLGTYIYIWYIYHIHSTQRIRKATEQQSTQRSQSKRWLLQDFEFAPHWPGPSPNIGDDLLLVLNVLEHLLWIIAVHPLIYFVFFI